MSEVMTITTDQSIRAPWGTAEINAVSIGSIIYVESHTGTYKYDTVNKQFTTLQTHVQYSPSITRMSPLLHVNGTIYAVRYTFNANTIYLDKYDISTNTWTRNFYSVNTSTYRFRSCYIDTDRFIFVGTQTTTSNDCGVYIIDPVQSTSTYKNAGGDAFPGDYGQISSGWWWSQWYYYRNTGYTVDKYARLQVNGTNVTLTPFNIVLTSHLIDYASFERAGKIYVLSGSSSFVYDIDSNTMQTLSDIDNPSRSPAINVGNTYYMFGVNGLYMISFITYSYTFNVKNGSGETTYLSYTDKAPISQIRFNYQGAGNDAGVILTTINETLTGTYTPEIPEGKRLSGYAPSRNATIVIYQLNTDIPIEINESFDFYEVYAIYNPPATTFDVDLYQCKAENNRVDKTSFLTSVGTLSGALRDECSMIAPSLVIEYDHTPEFNYVYISAFSRYFFVIGVTSVRKNLWRIDLKCDVLMTYASGILALSAYVARNENDYNDDLVDTQLPAQNDPTVIRQEIPNTVLSNQLTTEHNYVLTVVGSAEPPAPTP